MTQVNTEELIAVAKTGKLVSFPTDTVPALAVKPEQAELIFQAKQRSQDKPLILMGADVADLRPYLSGSEAEWAIWQALITEYWPGALTLVLPTIHPIAQVMNPLTPNTLGVRVPNSAIARTILGATGPLATTSANLSGQPALTTMTEIDQQFPQVFTLNIQTISPDLLGQSGQPSTVVKWQPGKGWQILRQGAIQLRQANICEDLD